MTTRAAPVACPFVRLNDDGTLDEVCGSGSFHLEQMDTNHWWMCIENSAGEVHVWLHAKGKITASHELNASPPEQNAVANPQGYAGEVSDTQAGCKDDATATQGLVAHFRTLVLDKDNFPRMETEMVKVQVKYLLQAAEALDTREGR